MLPAMGSNSSRAQVPQSLAAQGFLANAEKVQIPAFTRAKVRQIDRGSRAGLRAGRRSFPRSNWCRGAPWRFPSSCPPALLPSCPTPAIHPNAQHAYPSDQAHTSTCIILYYLYYLVLLVLYCTIRQVYLSFIDKFSFIYRLPIYRLSIHHQARYMSTHPPPCTALHTPAASLPLVAPSRLHRPLTAPCLVWSSVC